MADESLPKKKRKWRILSISEGHNVNISGNLFDCLACFHVMSP